MRRCYCRDVLVLKELQEGPSTGDKRDAAQTPLQPYRCSVKGQTANMVSFVGWDLCHNYSVLLL